MGIHWKALKSMLYNFNQIHLVSEQVKIICIITTLAFYKGT